VLHPRVVSSVVLLSAPFLLSAFCRAESNTLVRIDASSAWSAPTVAAYDPGSSRTPSGRLLSVDSREILLDGKPILPAVGEFHYARSPRAQWETELLKMKSAGITGVSTYAFWIHHEEREGQWEWDDQRDLRAFVELCHKHGLWVVLRVGPWAHGEARNGGLPDWLLQQGPVRRNHPAYLAHVQQWFQQLHEQVKGLLWKDGGPIVGIQLENEYAQRGPGAGEEHILTLRKMAREAGLDAPFYFATAWDNAAIPARAVMPIYGGGYPDAPWDRSLAKLGPGEGYAFHLQNRVTANMGAMGAAGSVNKTGQPPSELPFVTIEIGGGNEVTYHRRPVIEADDIGAMFPVMLGSGVNLYGTYMLQGGQNPDGHLSTLQESQATRYPNDVPIKSYDFQAPLSEFGEERASLRKMKLYQYFLADFGSELAAMQVHAPNKLPTGTADLETPRATVRSRGDAGFLFFNNYVRNHAMPARPQTQFEIALPSGTLRVPSTPVDLPASTYFIWPFNLRTGSVTLRYATAQLMARLDDAGVPAYYFAAVQGVRAELAFDRKTVRSVQAATGSVERMNGMTRVSGIEPGLNARVDVTAMDGTHMRFVVLRAEQAENAWKVHVAGGERLLVTSADVYAAPQAVHLLARGSARFAFDLLPAPKTGLSGNASIACHPAGAGAAHCTASLQAHAPEMRITQVRKAQAVAPTKLSQDAKHPIALAPAEGELPEAARWSIQIPEHAGDGLSELFLDVRYTGDVARIYEDKRLLADDFWIGRDWRVGLKRYLSDGKAHTLMLDILPLRKDAPVYFELADPVAFPASGQAVELNSAKLTPQYELVLAASEK